MKIAVIGSRNIKIENFKKYLPEGVTEIVSGGARGIDSCAAKYAETNGLKLTVFLPEYKRFGRAAPIIRNDRIIEYSDEIVALWDGKSKGTEYVIEKSRKLGKRVRVYRI